MASQNGSIPKAVDTTIEVGKTWQFGDGATTTSEEPLRSLSIDPYGPGSELRPGT